LPHAATPVTPSGNGATLLRYQKMTCADSLNMWWQVLRGCECKREGSVTVVGEKAIRERQEEEEEGG